MSVVGDEKILKEIGTRVCMRRHELGLTQETVSERMDVSVQMISNLELGKKAIRPENLIKLCNILDISADYILTGKKSESDLSGITLKFLRLSDGKQHLVEMLVDALLEEQDNLHRKQNI